jgi:hypothetical protein
LEKMANNKDASKAASLIKNHKIDPKLVPEVGDRLNKNMVRYFYKNNGWEGAEEIFDDNPEGLACLVEDLIFKKHEKEALSIWWRHQDITKFITKKESLEFFEREKQKGKEEIEAQIVENCLFRDYFGPSDPVNFLTLKDLGIDREAVIWVGDEPELIDRLV